MKSRLPAGFQDVLVAAMAAPGTMTPMASLAKKISDKITKEFDLFTSRRIDVEPVQTVCLAVGPYRNLTTLTGAVLFLHPNCQVLNHAGKRIFKDKRLNFLRKYGERRFRRFVRYAVQISQTGRRGDYGGSITLSHAFDANHGTKDVFDDTRLKIKKDQITSLFWKESLRTSRAIQDNHVDLNGLFARNGQLRFLLPIRNPLDCAVSNIKNGHADVFRTVNRNSSVEQVLDAVLEEFLWFNKRQAENPDRFFCFFEHDFNPRMLAHLAGFLQLTPLEEWLANSMKVFEIKSGYDHPAELIEFYQKRVDDKFSDYPDFAENLSKFGIC